MAQLPAVRGILANIEAGLVLKFQFNPTSIDTTKDVNYSYTNIPGWDHPDIVWESNGVKRFKFDLFFDRTMASSKFNSEDPSQGFITVGAIPLVGTEGVKAVIESFLYPEKGILDFFGGASRFTPPPRGLFILGTKFAEVIVEGGEKMSDMLFDVTMTPVRMLAGISLVLLEEGDINDVTIARRSFLAKAESIVSLADVISETFSAAVG